MSVQYHDTLAQVAVRINAMRGTLAADLQTTYLIRPLTSANFKSSVFPFDACLDALLTAEQKLVEAIAWTAGHPWRNFIGTETDLLANRDRLPTLAASPASAKIVGVWGAVKNSADGRICTDQPIETIERRNANPSTFWTQPAYYFRIVGDRIYHTRSFVVIDCCYYNRAVQKNQALLNGVPLLPDTLDEAYMCGALSYLVRDDEFVAQAAGFRAYFNEVLATIRSGGTSIMPFSPPSGSMNPTEG